MADMRKVQQAFPDCDDELIPTWVNFDRVLYIDDTTTKNHFGDYVCFVHFDYGSRTGGEDYIVVHKKTAKSKPWEEK